MAYVLMMKDEVNVDRYEYILKNGMYYVYDTTDGTIDLCSGRDIELVIDNGRQFLNYLLKSMNLLTEVCILNPNLGMHLRDNILTVAFKNSVRMVQGVHAIKFIILSNDCLELQCFDPDFNLFYCKFMLGVGSVINPDGKERVCKSLGRYKGNNAGAEIARRCI